MMSNISLKPWFPHLETKACCSLGRAGDGKTPRACMCALDIEVHQLHILKGLSCERAILGKGQGQKEDRAWEQEAMEAGLKDTRGLRVCCMSGTRQQCQNVNTRVVLKAPMRDGKQCGVFEIADLDELRENNCDAAGGPRVWLRLTCVHVEPPIHPAICLVFRACAIHDD